MKIMKTTLQERESFQWTTAIWCTNLFLCFKAMKIPDAKAAAEKEWEKTRNNTRVAADESQKQKWGDHWSKEWGQNSTHCVVNGSPSSQEFGVGATVSKIQRSSGTPTWHCERWFRILRSIHWTGISASQITAAKVMGMISRLPGCAGQAADTVSSYPGRNGSCTTTDKKSEVRMSRYLDASTTTQMDKIMVQYGKSSRSSWAKSVRSSFTRTIMVNDNSGKFYQNTVGKKFHIENAHSQTEKKDYSCLCMWTI